MNNRPLNEREKAIFALLEMDANMPAKVVAQKLKLKLHQVNYTIAELKSHPLAKITSLLNFFAIGYREVGMRFAFRFLPNYSNEKLRKALSQIEYLWWCAELGGPHQLGMAVMMRDVLKAADVQHILATVPGLEITGKVISIPSAVYYYGRRYLLPSNINSEPRSNKAELVDFEPDKLDWQIIHTLLNDRNSSTSEVARRLGLAHSTVTYRIQKMTSSNVFGGTSLFLPQKMLGSLSYRILVKLFRKPASSEREMLAFCKKTRAVVVLVSSVGDSDFELVVEVFEPEEVSTISFELWTHFGSDMSEVSVVPILSHITGQRDISNPKKRA